MIPALDRKLLCERFKGGQASWFDLHTDLLRWTIDHSSLLAWLRVAALGAFVLAVTIGRRIQRVA